MVKENIHSVASVRTLDEAKNTPGCLYYAMPVQVSNQPL
jgi:hypothetical protein